MKPVPPRYVNAPADIVYHPTLSRSMIVTYIRLKGLAWANQGQYTPPIHLRDLLQITGLERRAFYQHLSELRQTVPLRWESPQPGHLVLHFDEDRAVRKELVQKNALPFVVDSSVIQESEFLVEGEQQHGGFDSWGGCGGERRRCRFVHCA